MPRVFWVNSPVESMSRVTVLLAMLTVAAFMLLLGRPSFTNASRPPRFGDPMLALQFARDVQDVDWILGDAPSPDREVMRVKQYVDFGFITFYAALCAALGAVAARK